MSRNTHETTTVLRTALDLNKMTCNRIYSYDGVNELNSKAWVISNKKKLGKLKRTIKELDENMELRVMRNHRGTSLRVVKQKEAA